MLKVKDFNWKDLNGKRLYIYVESSEEEDKKITCAMGRDLDSDMMYVLDIHIENKYKNENYCWHCFGEGRVYEYGIEEKWEVDCLYCNGTGRTLDQYKGL